MIKLIIIDFYGVMTTGSYRDTCRWIAKKYKLNYEHVYDVIYHKYFNMAALGKITEPQSFAFAARELGLKETWQQLRKLHLSFQKLNKPVFNLCRDLQKQGFKILLLSKNTPGQFRWAMKKFQIRKHFKNVINTFDLKLPKASAKTIRYVLKKFKVRAQEVIMIDDQDFNLVQAKRAGVEVILYNNFRISQRQIRRILDLPIL